MSRSRLFLLLLLLATFSACGAPPEPTATPTATLTQTPTATPLPTNTPTPAPLPTAVPEATERATVRFFHAAPDLAPLDVYLEGSAAALRLPYGDFSLPLPLNEGEYVLRVVPARADVNQADALLRETIRVRANETILYVLRPEGETLRALRYPQDLRSTALGEGRVAAINALVEDVALSVFLDADIPIGAAQSGGQSTAAREVIARRYNARFLRDSQELLAAPLALTARDSVMLILYGTLSAPRLATLTLPTPREGKLRVVNAEPSLPKADLYLDERLVAEGVPFGVALEALTLPARAYRIRVLAHADPADAQPLFEGNIALAGDQQGLLVIYSTQLASNNRQVRAAIFSENLALPQAGRASLSVLNLARQEATIQALNPSTPLSAPIPYAALSAPISLNAGQHNLAFNTTEAEGARTVETTTLTLQEGWSYLYVVLSSLNTPPLIIGTDVRSLFAALPTPTISSPLNVRLINAAAAPISVDLIIGDVPIFKDVAHQSSTAALAIDSTMRPIRLQRSGTDQVLVEQTLQFAPNGNLAIVFFGEEGNWQLLQSLERTRPTASNAALRVIHAAPDAEPISVESPISAPSSALFGDRPTPTPRASQYFARLEYGGISSIVTLRANTYTFTARSAIDGTPLAELADVEIVVGMRYDLLLISGTSGNPRDVRLVLLKAE